MNLTKLFNLNYLKQNLKKSKAVLLIFILLLPILNTLVLVGTSVNNETLIPSLYDLSLVNMIGMYFLPVIISICLFSFLFKRKSVDFINSLPITRKSLFITNTLGGILLIIVMLLTNTLLIFIVSMIFNIVISFKMLIDYFVVWFIIYTFVFASSSLGNLVSGNKITSIIVTLLLIFFIPFMSSYTKILRNETINNDYYFEIEDKNITSNYICSKSDIECNLNKELNRYYVSLEKEEVSNYNPLFDLLFSELFGYKTNTLLVNYKLIILSIIYIILGYIAYARRKMEICETSFKNIHIHNIVKSLTLLPFMAVSYIICRNSSFVAIIFVIIVMLIYYIVYDLITRKSITNIKYLLFYFILSVCIYSTIFSCFGIEKDTTKVFKYSDITSVALYPENIDIRNISSDNISDMVFIKDKELLKILMTSSLSYNSGYYDDNNYVGYYERDNYVRYYIKIDNDIYSLYTLLSDSDYEKVLDIVYSNNDYIKKYKDIDFSNVYAVKLGKKVYDKGESKEIVKLIKGIINNMSMEEFVSLQNKYRYITNTYYDIKLYSYTNKKQEINTLTGFINYDLLNSVVNANNSLLKENITNIIPKDYYIIYSNKYFEEEYNVNNNLIDLASEELYSYILREVNNSVDMRNEYISLNICIENDCYNFASNNISEFKEILDSKRDNFNKSDEVSENKYEY